MHEYKIHNFEQILDKNLWFFVRKFSTKMLTLDGWKMTSCTRYLLRS